MSYALLHGYAQSDTLVNYAYGFLTLFLQGSAWGTFGGAFIGLMLERKPMRTGEWLGLISSTLFAGWVISFLVVDVIGFQINPPRNNSSIGFMGAALGQLIWLGCNKKPSGLRGAVLGYVGFGIGMAGGRLLGNIANVLQAPVWIHDQSLERHGDVVRLHRRVHLLLRNGGPPRIRNRPRTRTSPSPRSTESFTCWADPALAPTESNRSVPRRRTSGPRRSQSYGYSDPEKLANITLWLIDGVCVAGFRGCGRLDGDSLSAPAALVDAAGALALRDDGALSKSERTLFLLSRAAEVLQHASCFLGLVRADGALRSHRAAATGGVPAGSSELQEPRFAWERWLGGEPRPWRS